MYIFTGFKKLFMIENINSQNWKNVHHIENNNGSKIRSLIKKYFFIFEIVHLVWNNVFNEIERISTKKKS
jgi:hypothetical protein